MAQARDGPGDLILNREAVLRPAVINLRPQHRPVRGIHQPRRDPQRLPGAAHATFQQAADREIGCGRIPLLSPRHHAQPLHSRQRMDQLFRQTPAEGFVLRVFSAQHLEWRDRYSLGTRAGIAHLKNGRVAAFGELDPDRIGRALAPVVLRQFGTQPPRLHSHNRVQPRIVRGVAIKHLHPDDTLLQLRAPPDDCLLHRKAQEPRQARRVGELPARQQAFESGANRFRGRHSSPLSYGCKATRRASRHPPVAPCLPRGAASIHE